VRQPEKTSRSLTGNTEQAKEAIRRCRAQRDSGKAEAVLRGELQSWLRLIFPEPDDKPWIDHYCEGTEARTRVGQADGDVANRFIDNLVGSTTIEYEPDLRITTRREHGLAQVREHVAGLIRGGVPVSQVRGILSDTVEWLAYDPELAPGIAPAACSAEDITLVLVDELDLTIDEKPSATRFISFVRKHLAREQSRPLRADLLTLDLGLESFSCMRSADPLRQLVEKGRATSPAIMLATDLWSRFVDYLEGKAGGFRAVAYVDEVYLCILARLLSANVLSGHAISSKDADLKAILDGSYFKGQYQLANMVEQDYFGWLADPTIIDQLVPTARKIQQDLYVYDFSWRPEEDLFGRLMAQLARRGQRKLLGQEWTPSWLAHNLAVQCLNNLPEGKHPRIVDMCCGSGSIMAETLKAAKHCLGLTGINVLQQVATGFDIDPLAVSLAKTTWVVTLADEIKSAAGPIIIPIYHADSLFSVTPITPRLPSLEEGGPISVSLDGKTVNLPNALIQPEYHELFDRIVDWAYDEAQDARKNGGTDHLTEPGTAQFLDGAARTLGIALSAELKETLAPAVFALVHRMAELAVTDRNGIWAFILRNTYRPGLLAGQFNGLVSNPPWLAMSRLADNPYRDILTSRAELYGIRPPGQSFLHLELGTTHLLHAVDRYLAADAAVACLVPGTVFNGHHHELFRQRKFLTAARPVALEISEMWRVEPSTFKYPSAAVIGHKRAQPAGLADKGIAGLLASRDCLQGVDFSVRTIGGERTAWVLEQDGLPVTVSTATVIPQQGADLMPRTAVCIEIISKGAAEYRIDTPSCGTPYGFAVKAAKQLERERFPGYAEKRFIHRMAQSENLLPFFLGEHCIPIAIPAIRDDQGKWKVLDETEIRGMGFTETAKRFRTINKKLRQTGQGKTLQQRIDERLKLTKQDMPEGGYLILAGAGGKHICAACVPITAGSDLVVDQTLYWRAVPNEDEARFCVGLLNSRAMTEAITPFNPKGAFGERHIHTLPYRLMPAFDRENEDHVRIAALARNIATLAEEIVAATPSRYDPNRALTQRRAKLRNELQQTQLFGDLEKLCAAVLGTTAFSKEADAG